MSKRALTTVLGIAVLVIVPMGAYAAEIKDLAQMLTNVQNNIPYLKSMVAAFAYVMGVALILRSVMMFKKYGQMRTMMASNTSIMKPLIVMLVGVGLFGLPTLVESGIMTVYNYGSSNVMAYPAASDWSRVINPLIAIVKLMGLIVFVKGWLMLAKYGAEGSAQPGVGGKAVMHMIGGILAMNIVETIDLIKGTLGI